MVEQFKKYILDNGLLEAKDKILVAASAGVDSTVLCHLFHQINQPFAVAHCNFHLRANESDEDAVFVENLAAALGVSIFVENFQTEKYAAENRVSIQMAARELRYAWLFELAEKKGFNKIATAHHKDDNIETVLFNFAKGCGIRGMRGILPVNNNLIRPLLFSTKKEILEFALGNSIKFREDKSNFTDKYQRNKIRHHIIPKLEEINPNFQANSGSTIERLREVELIFNYSINKFRSEIISHDSGADEWKINLSKLRSSPAPTTVLYELILPFGFNGDQAAQILDSADNQAGGMFYSTDYRLLIDRTELIITKIIDPHLNNKIEIPEEQKTVKITDGEIIISGNADTPAAFSGDKFTAYFNQENIHWPLTLRHWQEGDWFQPFGMKGKKKKLQDYFSDLKLSRLEKEKIWVLESNGAICWIVGFRTDERFKVLSSSPKCLSISFISKK